MQKLSVREAPHTGGGLFSLLTRAFAVLVALGCLIATAWAQTAEKRADLAIRPAFREPVVLQVAYAYQQGTDWHRRRPGA